MLLLMAVQEEEWDEVDLMIRHFQNMTQAIKFSPKPVVVAPFGMTLGGGCEVALACSGAPTARGALHGAGGGGRRAAARRRRLQGDDAARVDAAQSIRRMGAANRSR